MTDAFNALTKIPIHFSHCNPDRLDNSGSVPVQQSTHKSDLGN